MRYYHYTCEHAAEKITAAGVVVPARQPFLLDIHLSWFTPIPTRDRNALGLTSRSLRCDRMEAIFVVDADDAHLIAPWEELKAVADFAPLLPRARILESIKGTRPALWAVAGAPVRARRLR